MKKCKFCAEAFTNIYEEDADCLANLIEFHFRFLDNDNFVKIGINESGELYLWAADNFVKSRKIKFCPMCGKEIPKITVSDAFEKRRGKA